MKPFRLKLERRFRLWSGYTWSLYSNARTGVQWCAESSLERVICTDSVNVTGLCFYSITTLSYNENETGNDPLWTSWRRSKVTTSSGTLPVSPEGQLDCDVNRPHTLAALPSENNPTVTVTVTVPYNHHGKATAKHEEPLLFRDVWDVCRPNVIVCLLGAEGQSFPVPTRFLWSPWRNRWTCCIWTLLYLNEHYGKRRRF